jgi:hypothetical protein
LVFRPTWEDMIIAYSSLPGYASVRDHEKGTWFIQSLVEGKPQGADAPPPSPPLVEGKPQGADAPPLGAAKVGRNPIS